MRFGSGRPSIEPAKLLPLGGPRAQHRFLSHAQSAPHSIAVLGGGITGLATASFLTRECTDAKVTLYEGSNRLGGWIQSKQVEVDGGTVLFEQGPRSLRGGIKSLKTLELVAHVEHRGDIISLLKSEPAAKNRYIYYPNRLTVLPNLSFEGLVSLITEPFLLRSFAGIFRDLYMDSRPQSLTDESVARFLSRRFGQTAADTLASALLHGIYAGDSTKLSARSLFPLLWNLETKIGSVCVGAIINRLCDPKTTAGEINETVSRLGFQDPSPRVPNYLNTSIWTTRTGLSEVVYAIVSHLENCAQVEIKKSINVKRIRQSESNGLEVCTSMGTARHTHVISTLPAEATASLCHNDNGEALVPSLSDIPAVTVMVVNLYFRTPNLLPVKGFGYLIPQNAPFDHNPERALGVVFDSFQTFQDTVDGTKVTVMLGGHWWDGWTAFPDSAQGVALARALLKRHLYISEEPEAVNAVLQRNCIPQYTVGHHERLERAHAQLLKVFHGKVRVAGSSYFGVGVHDCAAAALNAALSIKNSPWASVSGLEQAFESVLAF